MKIGGLQKVSLMDYPGKVCAVVFTQGCNFRCPYCHNPELVDIQSSALSIPVEEFIVYLKKRQGKIEAVTVSGGEPTIQEGLIPFIRRIKDMGFLVKIDTNGSQPGVLQELIETRLVDYIAMDVKAPLEKYPFVTRTQVNVKDIVKSLKIILTSGIECEFRTTVVKSQLTCEDILSLGELLRNAPRLCLQRFVPSKTLDRSFLKREAPTTEELSKLKKILEEEKNIGKVIIR